MKVLFLHGWHSTPGGRKPTYLASLGYQVLNPALCPDDFDKACRTAQEVFDSEQPDVVIGSSRGGAVAMNLRRQMTPLVLMCPAWKHWGVVTTVEEPVLILHSKGDEVIPFSHSQELVRSSDLDPHQLIETGEEHRLAGVQALESMAHACQVLELASKRSPHGSLTTGEETHRQDILRGTQ